MLKVSEFEIPPVPRYVPVDKRQVELNFHGTVAAGARATVITSHIMYKYRILQAKMIFTPDANNNIQVSWYVSTNESISATAPPSGQNIFGRENPLNYFVGDNLVRIPNCNVKIEAKGTILKCHVLNNGGAAFVFNNAIIIQEI